MPNSAGLRLSLVVAACTDMGIGVNNTLPWRLRGDMAFFKRLTTNTSDSDKCNAVVMGRKTWESIPSKFRPLPNRLNVIVSSTLAPMTDGTAHVTRSFEEALEFLANHNRLHSQLTNRERWSDLSANHERPDLLGAEVGAGERAVESIFIVGGASVYEAALRSPSLHRVYLTRVLKHFPCDTFLPSLDVSSLSEIQVPGVSTELQTEGDVSYKFCVYEAKVSGEVGSRDPHTPVCISAAVDLQMGFGFKGVLPWPHLKGEYEHFISLVTHRQDPDKKVVFVKGRRTWEDTGAHEKELPSVVNIVISTALSHGPPPAHVWCAVDSFDAAMQAALSLVRNGTVERIWIMGGASVYQAAIDSPLCQRIYLSHIQRSFDCDVHFPPFTHKFTEISSEEGVAGEGGIGGEGEGVGGELRVKYAIYERLPMPDILST